MLDFEKWWTVTVAHFIGRDTKRQGFPFRRAMGDDGGDTAHPVQKAGLQAGHGPELPARRRAGADAGQRHANWHCDAGQQQNPRRRCVRPQHRRQDKDWSDDGQESRWHPAGE